MYSDRPGKGAEAQKLIDSSIDAVQGMEPEEALVHIAKSNNGELNSTASRKILEKAGILTGENTQNAMWAILKSSKHFKKLEGRGRYALVTVVS